MSKWFIVVLMCFLMLAAVVAVGEELVEEWSLVEFSLTEAGNEIELPEEFGLYPVSVTLKNGYATLSVEGIGDLVGGKYEMDENGNIVFYPEYDNIPQEIYTFADPVLSQIELPGEYHLQVSIENGYGVLRAGDTGYEMVATFE